MNSKSRLLSRLTSIVATVALFMCALLLNGQPLMGEDLVPTVLVGNPGNEAKEVSAETGLLDPRWFKSGNFGSVPYEYRIGTTEVTNAQYSVFLNAVAAHDRHGLFNQMMADDPRGGIIQSGEHRNYSYSTKPNMADKPVIYVNYWDALRFANWMHNGQPSGSQVPATTDDGAYPLLNRTVPQLWNQPFERNPGAKWFIPSENEWFKAAYHKNDGVTGNYWDYPTSTNDEPGIASANEFGDVSNPGNNVVNYALGADWNGMDGNLTTVGSAGSTSAYGTFDQAGNVDEWTDTRIWSNENGSGNLIPIVRGGTFYQVNDFHIVGLAAGTRDVGGPNGHVDHIGFRVATIVNSAVLGDCNLDGAVDLLDIDPFIGILTSGGYLEEADCDQDSEVNFMDVAPFIQILTGS